MDTLHLLVYQELLVGKEQDFKAWCLSLGEKYKEYNEAMIKEHELGPLWYLATLLDEKLYGQLNLDAFVQFEMANYKGVITEVLRRGYEAMLNTVGALEDFQNILICGGGGAVFYDFLCEHYPALRRRLRNGADSTFSNVRGFHVVSEFMREQTTAAR